MKIKIDMQKVVDDKEFSINIEMEGAEPQEQIIAVLKEILQALPIKT